MPDSRRTSYRIGQYNMDEPEDLQKVTKEVLEMGERITSLELTKLNITPTKATFLKELFTSRTACIREVIFHRCKIHAEAMKIILHGLKDPTKELHSLIFEEDFIQESTAKIIGDLLSDCNTIKKLVLFEVGLGDLALAEVCRGIA